MQSLEMLRASDLAPMLGVSACRVYQLIAAGEIPAVRIGRAIRVPRRAWDQWVEGRSKAALSSVRASEQPSQR